MMTPLLWGESNTHQSTTQCFRGRLLQACQQTTDNIIITFLQWEKHSLHLSEEQMIMLEEQRNKTAKLFHFTATSNKQQQHVSMGRSAIHLLETQHGSQPR
jgi:hypothetical protein